MEQVTGRVVPVLRGRVHPLVVGGGQGGLAVGYHLRRLGRGFVVLDRDAEVGASWRRRGELLRLFTPAGFSHLPGTAIPAAPDDCPTKDAMARLPRAYAGRFALPVELSTTVVAVDRADAHLGTPGQHRPRW